jgi:hypothetical protein
MSVNVFKRCGVKNVRSGGRQMTLCSMLASKTCVSSWNKSVKDFTVLFQKLCTLSLELIKDFQLILYQIL